MSFIIGGIASNPVVIDVTGTTTQTYTPPTNYYPLTSNYMLDYYGNYPRYYNPQAALDFLDAAKYYNGVYPGSWRYGAYSWLNAPY